MGKGTKKVYCSRVDFTTVQGGFLQFSVSCCGLGWTSVSWERQQGVRYSCSYGPEDNRKMSSNKKRDRTYQKKRGCTCHFIVKVLYGRPDVAILTLKQPLHVDKNGESCHGMDDTSNDLRSQFAPNLSDECKAYIERLLLMDVSVDAIMDKHLDDPVFHDMLKKRDSFVTRKDVINAAMRVCSIVTKACA
ncbi:hypothetical protein SUGI_0713290 [Cryptomeria japonica]|nr:hypothetical protein SUGI_0713290 [Cryptomeria japonica]